MAESVRNRLRSAEQRPKNSHAMGAASIAARVIRRRRRVRRA
jgi:hypothetical protein